MSNLTREDIIEAHDALEDMHHIARKTTEKWDEEGITDFWKSIILKALPPKPQPTMAEVEWDDEEHYLAEAEYIDCGKVIMLYRDEDDGLIQCQIIGGKHSAFFAYSGNLTPTGERYTLTEVQE